MKLILKTSFLAFLMTTTTAFANEQNNLQSAREQITKAYIGDLAKADYKHIIQLFVNDGIVISTSKGRINAKDFFYTFLPNIRHAKTTTHQVFFNKNNSDRIAVRFQFDFSLKDDESGQGEYVDEFIFAKDSTKLTAVFMFENVKFNNEGITK